MLTQRQIATPGHELYGSHLEQHAIDSMIAPKDESSDLVMGWLKDAGLSSHAMISPRGDSVIVEASIKQIEKLLNAEYNAFGEIFKPGDALNISKQSHSPARIRRNHCQNSPVQPPRCLQRPRRHGPANHFFWPESHEIHNQEYPLFRRKHHEHRCSGSRHRLQRQHHHPQMSFQPLQLFWSNSLH